VIDVADPAAAGPILRIETSAFGPTTVFTVELLLADVGSGVADVTDAVFVIVPLNAALIEYVDVIVTTWPEASVASEHGYGVAQPPLFETKVVFAGVASETTTDVAADGPRFSIVTV
jgi:hypothetical protein